MASVKGRMELKSLVLRQVSASILNKEKEKRYNLSKQGLQGEELEKLCHLIDEEVIEVIASEAKKSREAIVEFEKGQRQDLVAKEKAELEILNKYLPQQLTEEEVKEIAEKIVKELGVQTAKDMGKVMAALMPKLKGRADGGLASRVVKGLLS